MTLLNHGCVISIATVHLSLEYSDYRANLGTEIYLKSIGHLQFKVAPFQIPANSHEKCR